METRNTIKTDVYQVITDRIMEQLENDIMPWKMDCTKSGMPKNLVSGIPYRGINVLLLGTLGYSQNLFLTYKQLKELGGKVKWNEEPCPVIYWQNFEEDKTKKPIPRYRNVYNVEQCEEIPQDKIPVIEQIVFSEKQCEKIIKEMPVRPAFQESDAVYYDKESDCLNMPAKACFESSEQYFENFFHKLVQSTAHPKRLDRKGFADISPNPAEQLIVEIGTSFLNALVGIEDSEEPEFEDINRWFKELRKDKRLIIYAATQAQKAVDFILHANTNAKEKEKELTL